MENRIFLYKKIIIKKVIHCFIIDNNIRFTSSKDFDIKFNLKSLKKTKNVLINNQKIQITNNISIFDLIDTRLDNIIYLKISNTDLNSITLYKLLKRLPNIKKLVLSKNDYLYDLDIVKIKLLNKKLRIIDVLENKNLEIKNIGKINEYLEDIKKENYNLYNFFFKKLKNIDNLIRLSSHNSNNVLRLHFL